MEDRQRMEDELMTDTDGGRGRDREVDDIDIMQAICDSDGPVATAAEIADAVGMTRAGATHRLHQLHERGFIASKDVGNGLVWWPDFYPVESESAD